MIYQVPSKYTIDLLWVLYCCEKMQPIQFLNKLIKYWVSAYYLTTYTVPIISHDFIWTHHKICHLQFHKLVSSCEKKIKTSHINGRVSGEGIPKQCDSRSTALNFENVSPVSLSSTVVKWDANCNLGMSLHVAITHSIGFAANVLVNLKHG
jgi:hypothetical protein